MAGGIQTLVNAGPAPASPGDFASANPRSTYTGGPGGLIAGLSGLTSNTFAWVSSQFIDADSGPAVANNFGTGAPTGFVHRDQQGLNTTFLLDASLFIPAGFPVTLFTAGDFWVKNSGASQVTPGMVAYASLSTGAITFATGSSAASTVTCATSAVTAGTWGNTTAWTGSLSGNTLTITTAGNGSLYAGSVITAGGAATGTAIVAQILPLITGEALNGVGRYAVSIPEQTVATNSLWQGTYGILTLGATPSGTFPLGGLLTGGTVAAGTYLTAYISGNGTANGNTIAISTNTTSGSATLTCTTNVATKWFAQSSGAAGESIKMSSWALG